MICDRCGRDNPNQLTFCQDCGQRLLSPKPAAPAPIPATSSRPEAPGLELRPEVSESELGCTSCGARNSKVNRFCVACGARLPVEAAISKLPSAGDAPSHAPPAVLASPPPAAIARAYAPASRASARLITIAEDGSEGVSHSLDADQIDLGREEGHIVLPGDPYLSPRHARFTQRDGAFYVRDLDSLNGIFVRLRRSSPLVDGDLLLIGLQVLKFELVNGAEQALGPATQHGTLVFGSPIIPRYARLSQRTVEGVTRNVFYLHKDETTIGRESGDIVFSDDPFLSRRHLVLRRDLSRGAFGIEDFGSSNGTYMAIRHETRLEGGDQIRIGQHLFRFELTSSTGHGEGARRVA